MNYSSLAYNKYVLYYLKYVKNLKNEYKFRTYSAMFYFIIIYNCQVQRTVSTYRASTVDWDGKLKIRDGNLKTESFDLAISLSDYRQPAGDCGDMVDAQLNERIIGELWWGSGQIF